MSCILPVMCFLYVYFGHMYCKWSVDPSCPVILSFIIKLHCYHVMLACRTRPHRDPAWRNNQFSAAYRVQRIYSQTCRKCDAISITRRKSSNRKDPWTVRRLRSVVCDFRASAPMSPVADGGD